MSSREFWAILIQDVWAISIQHISCGPFVDELDFRWRGGHGLSDLVGTQDYARHGVLPKTRGHHVRSFGRQGEVEPLAGRCGGNLSVFRVCGIQGGSP